MSEFSDSVRVAAVQAAPVFMDLSGTLARTAELVAEAAERGCDLIAFPECWIPGYPWFIWLNPTAINLKYFVAYHENSLVPGSEAFERIAEMARMHQIMISVGASERDHGSLYIAQFLFDRDGALLSGRRKLKPTHMERTVFGDGDGSHLQVVDTAIGRIGQLNCWEHMQPLTKYAMYAQHEQIHVAAWPSFSCYPEAFALGPQLNNALSQVYAAEGQCFVVAPCGVVSEAMLAQLVESELHAALLQRGGGYARIFGPDGRPMGDTLDPAEEGLVIADLDPAAVTLAKCFADPVGHYARPEITRLQLNRAPQPKVADLHEAPVPVAIDPVAESETLD